MPKKYIKDHKNNRSRKTMLKEGFLMARNVSYGNNCFLCFCIFWKQFREVGIP
jgi:hypothetical protein